MEALAGTHATQRAGGTQHTHTHTHTDEKHTFFSIGVFSFLALANAATHHTLSTRRWPRRSAALITHTHILI